MEDLIEDLERDGFGHWLAGFIAGEGCFLIHFTRMSKLGSYMCRFTLNLRADDSEILREAQRRTRLGTISGVRQRGKSRPGIFWNISSRDECLALTQILDRFPVRAKKARDYAIWREAVYEWTSRPPQRAKYPRDWSRMAELFQQIRDERAYIRPVLAEAPQAQNEQLRLVS